MKHSLSELLFEEELSMNTQQSEKDEERNQDEESEEGEKPKVLKPGSKLEGDDLISKDSSSHIEIEKAIPKILAAVKKNTKIKNMQNKFSKIDSENPSEEDVEFLTNYAEEVSKGDSGDGLLDVSALKILFQQTIPLGAIGKGSLNPVQLKKGASQMLGVTSADIKIYKSLKMIPFFVNVKTNSAEGVETVSGHKGNKNFYVVFVMPALGCVIEKDDLANYTKIFPKLTKDANLEIGSVVVDTDEINFCYVEGEEELALLQTNFVDKFMTLKSRGSARKSDGKPSEQEGEGEGEGEIKQESKLIYKKGLSFLLNEENVSFNVKPYIDIVTDTTLIDKESRVTIRDIDYNVVRAQTQKITYQNYKKFIKIAHEEYKKNQKEKTKEKSEMTADTINSVSDVGQSLMGGYMAYLGGAAVLTLSVTSAGAGLALLPYVMGAKLATPGIAKGAGSLLRIANDARNWNEARNFKKYDVDTQIRVMLSNKLETGEFFYPNNDDDDDSKMIKKTKLDFKSVDDESIKLFNAFKETFESVLDTDYSKDEKAKKRKDNVKITIADFETVCNKQNYQLTQINDIPREVYQNFLIDCNDLLRQSKVEIDKITNLNIRRKSGFKEEDINFNIDEDSSVNEETQKMSKSERIQMLKDCLDEIKVDSPKVALIKAIILSKLGQGDEEAAHELILDMLKDPQAFTEKVQKVLENDEVSTEEAVESFDADIDAVEDVVADIIKTYISEKEVTILKKIDELMCLSFGVNKDDYAKSSGKSRPDSNITVYSKTSDLPLAVRNTPEHLLARPVGVSLEPFFSFNLLFDVMKLGSDTEKKLKKALIMVYSNTLAPEDKDAKNSDLFKAVFYKGMNDNDRKKLDTGIKKFNAEWGKAGIVKQIEEAQGGSTANEGNYYSSKLTSILFESSLKNLNFGDF